MVGFVILLLLILVSALPVFAVYLWFRIARYPFSRIKFLFFLLAGAAAFFFALIAQSLFPATESVFSASINRWNFLRKIFIRVAFTEELGRLIALILLFWTLGRFGGKENSSGYGSVSRASAAGLVAGLGFAALEGAVYGALDAGTALLRVFTAAPLHGACGARVGAAAVMLRERTAQAVFRFLSAVLIHGIYNFMILMPGFPSVAAVIIALSALVSSVLTIRGGFPASA
ncbi:MAG: PrsW family intramembrane metalloprotease [Treponema sp.]|jgi:RsiW-degrading membrane proteinase PrsW (M82 family)|nr:PrsW family intramembrane metalloprotease [Treponema sp.]